MFITLSPGPPTTPAAKQVQPTDSRPGSLPEKSFSESFVAETSADGESWQDQATDATGIALAGPTQADLETAPSELRILEPGTEQENLTSDTSGTEDSKHPAEAQKASGAPGTDTASATDASQVRGQAPEAAPEETKSGAPGDLPPATGPLKGSGEAMAQPLPTMVHEAVSVDAGSPIQGRDIATGALHIAAPLHQPAVSQAFANGLSAPGLTILVAVPEQLGELIVERASLRHQGDDRILVQLDPPELGRVGIDFRYDAQGVAHITVTAESQDALRQLRQMHADLLAALDRQGIGGGEVDYRQGDAERGGSFHPAERADQARHEEYTASNPGLDGSGSSSNGQTRKTPSEGRLDIRL